MSEALSLARASAGPDDRVLELLGEVVVLRRDRRAGPPAMAVMEEFVPPGVAAPLHRHRREDEISYVIKGTFRIWRGDEVFDAGPGATVFLPRNEVHTFANVGAGVGRLLTVISPAGLETFFEAIVERGLAHDDEDGLIALAAEYGLEIVGPPPEI